MGLELAFCLIRRNMILVCNSQPLGEYKLSDTLLGFDWEYLQEQFPREHLGDVSPEAAELAAISGPKGKEITDGNMTITKEIDLPDRT